MGRFCKEELELQKRETYTAVPKICQRIGYTVGATAWSDTGNDDLNSELRALDGEKLAEYLNLC